MELKGQVEKIFIFGIPLIIIIFIATVLFVKNKYTPKSTTVSSFFSNNPDNINLNSNTPTSSPIIVSGFPKVTYRRVAISYGLSTPQPFNVNFFTGIVNKVTVDNETFMIEITDPVSKNTFTFHFSKYTGVSEMTDPNQTETSMIAMLASEVTPKLAVGKYISIRFDDSIKINSTSEMASNEANYNKQIIIYNFIK